MQRTRRALDHAVRNIREGVEDAVARGRITSLVRQFSSRVSQQIGLDRRLLGSAMRLSPKRTARRCCGGEVADAASLALAVDLARNPAGDTGVEDEVALVQDVRAIDFHGLGVRAGRFGRSGRLF